MTTDTQRHTQKYSQKHMRRDPHPSSRPLSQMLLVVRLCATPLSRLPGNRGCINMRGREGAGDTSCLWSESNHDSVSVKQRFRSQHPPLSVCLSLIAVQRSRSAQLVIGIHTQPLEHKKGYVRLNILLSKQGFHHFSRGAFFPFSISLRNI